MEIKTKLEFLDRIAPLSYSNPVTVLIDNNPDKVVGSCIIVTDADMNHFGEFNLDENIVTDLYLYYFHKNTSDGNYHLSHLSLHNELRKDLLTKKLKEMIV